jgi:hypothetical protein
VRHNIQQGTKNPRVRGKNLGLWLAPFFWDWL